MIIYKFPHSGYRRFVGPDEAAARRQQEARGEVARVIQMSGGSGDVPVDRSNEEGLARKGSNGRFRHRQLPCRQESWFNRPLSCSKWAKQKAA